MSILVWSKAVTLWGSILVVAVINGAIREQSLVPIIGNFWGTFASGILLSVSIFLVSLITIRWYGILESSTYWKIGMLWLALTLLFEFTFGLFVAHRSWEELFEAYLFKNGNIWPIVLVSTLLSPWFGAKLRGLLP